MLIAACRSASSAWPTSSTGSGVRRRNGTVRLNAALAEAASGAWSLPEAELARLLRRCRGFAGLMANPASPRTTASGSPRPDLWIDEVALAIMVHSRRFHSDVLDWDSTVDATRTCVTPRSRWWR